MINITINGRAIEAGADRTILEAALENGIYIPNLCHDKRLKPYGACRLCLVEVKGARKLQTACSTKLKEGMVVETETPRLRQLRRTIIDLMLSDHRVDCVTCESTGDCRLQDLAYSYSVEKIRFEGEKSAHAGIDNNPLIERDYSKCILCGRCVRICDEVQGAFAVDFVGRGFSGSVDTSYSYPLPETTCEFCGQCVSSCPTGALIDKPSMNQGRAWQVQKTRTVCSYCGCGCTIDLHTNDGVVVGVSAPVGVGANKGNLCGKGRYGYAYINHPDRLKTPLIRKNGELVEASWDEAINLVATKLFEVKREHGADSIAGFASAKCTNEDNYIFQKFMRAVIGTNNVDVCARL